MEIKIGRRGYLSPERQYFLSLLAAGYRVHQASYMLGYCADWGRGQLRELRQQLKCKTTYAVIFELCQRGFIATPEEQVPKKREIA